MPLDNLSELKRRVPGGKYTLARAIAERARQLQSGKCMPLVEVRTPNPLSVAIDEIVQGKITFRFGEDADIDEVVVEEVHAGSPAAPSTLDEALAATFEEAPAAPSFLTEPPAGK